MTHAMAWTLFALGIGHIAYGLVAFKAPESRRTAFWFLIFGPLLMLAGHAALHAVAIGDLSLLGIVGTYAFVTSLIGVAAFPKSPFIASLLVSALLNGAVYGLV